MTAKALRRKKVSIIFKLTKPYLQNRKVKQEAKKEKATAEEAILRKEALQQIAGGDEESKVGMVDSPNMEAKV